MAYVREKKVPGKGDKTYSYYQLVEGRRVDGKVRQRVVAHLGKHDSIEAARAAARAAAARVVPKESGAAYMEKLREINAEYLTHFHAWVRQATECKDDLYGEVRKLKGQRSRTAPAKRALLKERQAQIKSEEDKAKAAKLRAASIYDALSPVEQEYVGNQNLAVVNHLEDERARLEYLGPLR